MTVELIVIAGLVKHAGKIMSGVANGFSDAFNKILEIKDKEALRRIKKEMEPITTQMSDVNVGKALSFAMFDDYLKKPTDHGKVTALGSALTDALSKLQALIKVVEESRSGLIKISGMEIVTDLVTALKMQEIAFGYLESAIKEPDDEGIEQLREMVSDLKYVTNEVKEIETRISKAVGDGAA